MKNHIGFYKSLEIGKTGENIIAKWLMSKGWYILPAYEKVEQNYKGPVLFSQNGKYITPDMFCIHAGRQMFYWIEAKNKNAFSWYRAKQIWTTGIDTHHFEQYLQIRELIGFEIYLMFLQNGGQAKDSPQDSPSGLYGGEILRLKNCIDHAITNEHPNNYGKGGMTYWSKDSLYKYATIDELMEIK